MPNPQIGVLFFLSFFFFWRSSFFGVCVKRELSCASSTVHTLMPYLWSPTAAIGTTNTWTIWGFRSCATVCAELSNVLFTTKTYSIRTSRRPYQFLLVMIGINAAFCFEITGVRAKWAQLEHSLHVAPSRMSYDFVIELSCNVFFFFRCSTGGICVREAGEKSPRTNQQPRLAGPLHDWSRKRLRTWDCLWWVSLWRRWAFTLFLLLENKK